jgi:hypothetical protein
MLPRGSARVHDATLVPHTIGNGPPVRGMFGNAPIEEASKCQLGREPGSRFLTMLIFTKNSCLSIVADRNEPRRWIVRAYFEGDIERFAPNVQVIARPDSQFRYRAFVDKDEVIGRLLDAANAIEYDEFGTAVDGEARKQTYTSLAATMRRGQGKEPFPLPPSGRVPVIRSDWQTKPMGWRREIVNVHQEITTGDFERIRLGLLPLQMEDKWFMYYEEPFLYCHRSWTGFEPFRLDISCPPDPNHALDQEESASLGRPGAITSVTLNMNPEEYECADPGGCAQEALTVVAAHLLGRTWSAGEEADPIGLWHVHGQTLSGEGPKPGRDYRELLAEEKA